MDLPNKQAPPPEPPPKKHIVPIVADGLVVKTPRPVTRRFLDFVFAESPQDLMKRIGRDVLVPRAKAGLEEAMNNFIHGMFWGQGSAPISSIVKGTVLRGGGMNYNAISSQQPSALTQAREANTSRSTGNYQDLTCPSQEIAERLLAQLYEVFNQYRVVAVADLYEMATIPTSPSDNAYGWLSLDGARITKERDGYVLALPRPTLI
jgi:hypothetical protein